MPERFLELFRLVFICVRVVRLARLSFKEPQLPTHQLKVFPFPADLLEETRKKQCLERKLLSFPADLLTLL